MPAVFFFPWLQTTEVLELGGLRLVPYVRGAEPAGSDGVRQAALDGVLRNYGDRRILSPEGCPRPVQRATLVEWIGDAIDTELADDELTERMTVGQWVAFSALSCRKFGSHFEYCNSDDLQFIGQRFDPTRPGALVLPGRRRDGGSMSYLNVSKDAPTFVRPHHAQAARVKLDAPLIVGLLALKPGDLKHKLTSAISVYLRANTDAPGVPMQSELTLMRVACETLLGSGHEKKDVRVAFNKHFVSEVPVSGKWGVGALTETTWRSKYTSHVHRPLDAWVHDFCAARNKGAHGKNPNEQHPEPVWSVENHLLFISWLFPLMVKKELADSGLYELSDLDKDSWALFEQFFAHDILALNKDKRVAWCEVEDEIRMRVLERTIKQNLPRFGLE